MMGFEKLQLPDFLLADLYKDNLVVSPDIKPVKKVVKAFPTIEPELKEAEQKWFLGDNKRNMVILVNDEEAVYLRDASLQFLSNILNACKLNLGDVAILNQAKTKKSYSELVQTLSPQFLLLFDVTAQSIELSFTIPFYQVQRYGNCSFLLAPSFQKIDSDKLEKSKLWLSLQKMLGI